MMFLTNEVSIDGEWEDEPDSETRSKKKHDPIIMGKEHKPNPHPKQKRKINLKIIRNMTIRIMKIPVNSIRMLKKRSKELEIIYKVINFIYLPFSILRMHNIMKNEYNFLSCLSLFSRVFGFSDNG